MPTPHAASNERTGIFIRSGLGWYSTCLPSRLVIKKEDFGVISDFSSVGTGKEASFFIIGPLPVANHSIFAPVSSEIVTNALVPGKLVPAKYARKEPSEISHFFANELLGSFNTFFNLAPNWSKFGFITLTSHF